MGSSAAEWSLVEKEPTSEGSHGWGTLQGDPGVSKKAEEELGVKRNVQMVERGCPGSKCKALLCGQNYTSNFHKEPAWEDARSPPLFVMITSRNRAICPVKAVFSPLHKTVMLARETEFRISVYGTKNDF